jgi:hypothetical protein
MQQRLVANNFNATHPITNRSHHGNSLLRRSTTEFRPTLSSARDCLDFNLCDTLFWKTPFICYVIS